MRNFLILILLCSTVLSCKSQKNETNTTLHELDPIVQAAKDHSLYADRVNWEETNAEFIRLTGTQETLDDLKPGLDYLLIAMGDKHGQFRKAEDFSFVAWYKGPADVTDTRDSNFINNIINSPEAEFSYEMLENNVGYLKVVGIGPNKTIEQHTAQIRNGLKDLASQNADKWILDLRFNGGGNMNPMIAGLAPLLGDGKIGGTVFMNGELNHAYEIRNGQFYDWDQLAVDTEAEPKSVDDDPIVVLLSKYTISSGELLAVTFKGRPNTTFIGEPSAGYTTSNGYVQVRDDLFMMISESLYLDRNGVVYEGRVGVDLEMEFDIDLVDHSESFRNGSCDDMVKRGLELLGK